MLGVDMTPSQSAAETEEHEHSIIITFREGVLLRSDDATGNRELYRSDGGECVLTLPALPSSLVPALQRVIDGALVASIEDELLDNVGIEALAQWYALLAECEAAGVLTYEVRHSSHVLMRFTPAAAGRTALYAPPSGALRLSRFAFLHRDADTLCLDSPRARGRITVAQPMLATAIAAFSTATTRRQIAAVTGIDVEPWIGDVISLLVASELLHEADADGLTDEDRSIAAQHWEFADLLLHARSRPDRSDLPVGGTYRFDDCEPPPVLKPPMSEIRIALFRPNIDALNNSDVPMTRVMETRASVRKQGAIPITAEQLGEFLYRVARVRPDTRTPGAPTPVYEFRRRLYPGGGACHPLEIYAAISRCDGLHAGLYHYDPDSHALELLDDPTHGARELLQRVSVPMDGHTLSQIVLVFSARFRRLSWKYEGNAYALLLQEVGVLYQSMYLVATAMGLAPCAVGGGDANRFAEIIGTDPLDEGSVGAFTLGSAG